MGKEYTLCRDYIYSNSRVHGYGLQSGMGQVSVLVSVFGGKIAKPEHGSWLVTLDDYDHYYYALTIYIIWIIEYPWDGSTSWIFIVIILL